MFFQIGINNYSNLIAGIFLILGGMLIFKIGLTVTKAESKTNFKWVAISFLLQYGVTLFISAPMLLDMVLTMITGPSDGYRGPNMGLLVPIVIFSTFIVVNLINMLHKPGIKRSLVTAILILGPIVGSNYLIFSSLGL